ncbi:hemin-degrading factor [Saccharospirillum impatiens]|uniref:hemin-degrading factor n=1 Tax=Saccharospirillum impatiens TaxID=169438 RepID=UPI000418E8B2|nr:hemin-degrading factor [Saccharospirillum impatiens]
MTESTLASAWLQLKQDQPSLRIRNAAELLGVSELELLLAQPGANAVPLQPTGRDLALHLPGLGRLMALVRNDNAVHETSGRFADLQGGGMMGMFLTGELGEQDQRFFFRNWRYTLAVTEGERQSIQVFDDSGTAVIKLYRLVDTQIAHWENLVAQHSDTPITPEFAEAPAYERTSLSGSAEAMMQDWRALTDVHQFNTLLKNHGVDRLSAFEAADDDLALQVDAHLIETALFACQLRQIPLMTFVSNRGAVQIHTRVPGTLRRTGPWFNILDPDFNLHLNTEGLASAWISRRPTVDGWVHSLEGFDEQGRSVVQFFGQRAEGRHEREDWRALMDELVSKAVVAA